MQHQDRLIPVAGLHRVGLEEPEPALHLVAGEWQASCPTCGWLLCHGRRQDKVERRAQRIACPVCHLDGAA